MEINMERERERERERGDRHYQAGLEGERELEWMPDSKRWLKRGRKSGILLGRRV